VPALLAAHHGRVRRGPKRGFVVYGACFDFATNFGRTRCGSGATGLLSEAPEGPLVRERP
jgi:hypothetical protein